MCHEAYDKMSNVIVRNRPKAGIVSRRYLVRLLRLNIAKNDQIF